jgi:hypothetical protein
MRNLMLLAGVAAFAAAMPALAQGNDRGGGGGGGRGHGQAAHANHQAAHANQQKGAQPRADHGRDHGQQPHGGNHGGQADAQRRLNGQQRQAERAIASEHELVREARSDRRNWSDWSQRSANYDNRFNRDFARYSPYRPVAGRTNGCPPGLARQNRYCMPPGQLRHANYVGRRLPIASLPYNVPDRYRYRFVDSDRYFYRYGNDGLIYRFDPRGIVSSVIPMMSSGLYLGEPLPLGYDVYNVPLAYRSYYRDTSDYLYRYDGNAIYRVNPSNMMVDGIAALITAGVGGLGGLGVGDRLPVGYDAYNVPIGYRDTYYDTNDRMYRYADGAIYQVDPQTSLIMAVISLLV